MKGKQASSTNGQTGNQMHEKQHIAASASVPNDHKRLAAYSQKPQLAPHELNTDPVRLSKPGTTNPSTTSTNSSHKEPNPDTLTLTDLDEFSSGTLMRHVRDPPSVNHPQSKVSDENLSNYGSDDARHNKKSANLFAKGLRMSRSISRRQMRGDSKSPTRTASTSTISLSKSDSSRSIISQIGRSTSHSPVPSKDKHNSKHSSRHDHRTQGMSTLSKTVILACLLTPRTRLGYNRKTHL